MNKIIAVFINLFFVLTLSCSKSNPITTRDCDGGICESIEASFLDKKYSNDNWEFKVIGEGWVQAPSSHEEVKLINKDKLSLIFLIKGPADTSFEDFVLESMTTLSSNSEIKNIHQVIINDNIFIKLYATTDLSSISVWLSKKDNNFYAFTCGGPYSGSSEILCPQIINTLQIH